MKFSLVVVAVLVACGGKSNQSQLAPLPPDPPAQPPVETKVEPPEPAKPPPRPIDITIPGHEVKVKLVAKGKGKLAPLRYTAKAGGKQQLEIAMDFTAKQTEGTDIQEQIIPTMVLVGSAETTAVDKDGKADFAVTISSTEARDVQGSKLPAEKFKTVLAGLAGLVIGGSIDAAGNAGDVKMKLEKPDDLSEGALELIRLTLPAWPVLPKEPIGVGAKWQTTTTSKLADKLVVTQTTDYELVAHQGTTWSIKGKTKVTGSDQDVDGGKISAISGSGTTEVTLADGALYPTHKTALETQFLATEDKKSIQFVIKVGGAITAK